MRKGLIAAGVLVMAGGVTAVLYSRSSTSKVNGFKTVAVTRGSVTEKALAIGAIRPKREIAVKSKISGIVKTSYREIGDKVKPGDPLFEILPDPTPLELTEARREVEIARNVFDQAQKKHDRSRTLRDQGILATQEWDQSDKEIQDARIRLELRRGEARAHREGPGEGRPPGRPPGRRVDHPRPDRRHRARAARQRGRSGRAAHLVPGGDGAHEPRGHEHPRLQGHGRRDRRRQAPRGDAGAHQDRRPARGQGRREDLQDLAEVQDRRGRDALRRGDPAVAQPRTWSCARATRRTRRSRCARSTACCWCRSGS